MCNNPILAARIDDIDGKSKIKFLTRVDWNIAKAESHYGKENVYKLPCGKCSECSAIYRAKWAKRSMMEYMYHHKACFITLTYDDKYLPSDGKLCKKDVQDFLKRLRNSYKVRYLFAGEYGLNTLRPHYHAILFGYFPEDFKVEYRNPLGQVFYTSNELNFLWRKGFVVVSDVTKETCSYVAGYTAKKDNPVLPGFILSSKKPGLGVQFVLDHAYEIIENGCFVVPGFGMCTASRFELDLLEKNGFDVTETKKKRDFLLDEKFNSEVIAHGYRYKDELSRTNKFNHRRKRGL